ncbi:hypothetical protein EXN66_Car007213 [Channa argus]|uniref:Uncharacterized protein n=1 Tax=Channa argus TaxID=215402 RepID=A0A6G1PNH1_CHAAH|nr:hypothetical protein EXN66_Car007213 [Channa argus]
MQPTSLTSEWKSSSSGSGVCGDFKWSREIESFNVRPNLYGGILGKRRLQLSEENVTAAL